MGRRRQAREAALQSLYLSETGHMSIRDALHIILADSTLDEDSDTFARELAAGADGKLKDLDDRIQEVAKNWALDRMTAVDRNLLRLASYELLHGPKTPASVVIDEALEIAKIFSSADSSKFINGILDKMQPGAKRAKKTKTVKKAKKAKTAKAKRVKKPKAAEKKPDAGR